MKGWASVAELVPLASISEGTPPSLKARRTARLNVLLAATVLGVILELPLNRWLPLVGPAVGDAGAAAALYRVFTSLGGIIHYAVILFVLLFFAGLIRNASGKSVPLTREKISPWLALGSLLAITGSFLVGFEEATALRLFLWLANALLLLLSQRARWKRRSLLVFSLVLAVSYTCAVYYSASYSVLPFFQPNPPPLALVASRIAELTMVAWAALLPIFVIISGGVPDRRTGTKGVVVGLLLGGGLALLMWVQPANTQLVVQWTFGLSLEFPPALYVAALAGLGFSVAVSLIIRQGRSLGCGLTILCLAGFVPGSLYQYCVTLLGLWLFSQSAGQPLPRVRAGGRNGEGADQYRLVTPPAVVGGSEER